MGRPALALSIALGLAACGGGDDDDVPDLGPDAVNDLVTVDEDAPIAIDVLANDTDPGGKPLTLLRASSTDHEVTVDGPLVRIPTVPDWSGTIEVRYVVSNGEQSASARAVITVAPVNDAPTARAGNVATGRNHAQAVLLQGDDIDGDTLTFEIESGPAHGTLSGTAPQLTYTPADGYVGYDAIVFHARDAALSSAAATIGINVVNGTAPVALPQSLLIPEDAAWSIVLAATDVENDTLTFAITSQPSHGTITGTPPYLTYTPNANYVGNDVFSFTANDGALTSAPANVGITMNPVNDPPVAQVQVVATTEDTPASITLVGTDVDGDPLSFYLVQGPTRGTLSGSGAQRTYTPYLNLNGNDSFRFYASDGHLSSETMTVSIVVAPVNDAPVALTQSVAATEDMPRSITLAGSDVDGDPLTYVVNGGNWHGDVTGAGPTVTYTPGPNYYGLATLTFTANDGHATSPSATVSINVAAVDDAPFVPSLSLSGAEDANIAIPLPATDVDGEFVSYVVTTPPAHGAVYGSAPNLVYRAVNYDGTDSFAITASDGHHTSLPGTFSVTITPVEDAPIARDDFEMATAGQWLEIDVLANDEEVDDEPFFIQSVTSPNNGEAQTDGDRILYRSAAGDTTEARFTYTIVDSAGLSGTATVTVGIGRFPTGAPLRYVAHGPQVTDLWNLTLPHDVSDDGHYIAFTTAQQLVPEDTNTSYDVYVWDAHERHYERVSVPAAGGATNGSSARPSISADGRYVAFQSTANNLIVGDTNGQSDIFVRDRVAGTTTRVSVSSTGAQGTGPSTVPTISADGTVVAFQSIAFDLVSNDVNGAADVFVRDLTASTTTRISVHTGGGEGDALSGNPKLSGDGHVIAFTSSATNLVADDTNGAMDVFVHDRTTGITERVSVSSTGVQATLASRSPAISYDGRFVAFSTSAPNLVANSGTDGATAVRDRQAHTTTNGYPNGIGEEVSISADGRYLVGQEDSSSFVRDRFAAHTQFFTGPTGVFHPRISSNGRYVVAISNDALLPNLATGSKIFVYPNPL